MTVKVDLAEFVTAYVAEVDEQLQSVTSKLLVVEAAARKGERQPRSVRDLFRSMHTIKGLSAMVGVEAVVTIAHRVEAILREADRAGGAVALPVVDLLLRSAQAIEVAVRAVAARGSAPEPAVALLAELDVAVQSDRAPPGMGARFVLEPSIDQKLDPFERELLLKGATEGRRAVRLDYAPSAPRAAQGVNINTVRDRLGAVAEIVRVIPISLPPSSAGAGGVAFALLLLTALSDDELTSAAGLPPGGVQPVVVTDRITPTAALAPATPPADVDDEPLPELELRLDDVPRRNLLRVEAGKVDEAIDRLGALLVTRSRLARAIAQLAAAGSDTREIAQIASDSARQLRDLRTAILQVRMVPLAEILERLPLLLRSLMRASGRLVRLEVEASGAELDKAVAERVFPAIVHLVRNAVDHGIEPPEQRQAAGKPAEGLLRVACSARSNTRLELTIQDDGRGVDANAVATRLGVPRPESDAALLELLCRPGMSTRAEATATSGRGLGMDIVKRVVDQLGGEIALRTSPGRGTTFTLYVPLTVAVIDAFVIECGGQRFVVPLSSVEEILEIDRPSLVAPPASRGAAADRPRGMIERRGEALALYDLAALLGLKEDDGAPAARALVVRRAGEPLGFLLDRVVTQQEAVIRPLVDPLVRVRGVAAATDLGDGRPTLVLDLPAFASAGAARARAAELPEAAVRRDLTP